MRIRDEKNSDPGWKKVGSRTQEKSAPYTGTFVDGDVEGGLPALVPGVEVCARRRNHFHHPGLVTKRRMVHSLNKDDFFIFGGECHSF
jgi:hypothetical protein